MGDFKADMGAELQHVLHLLWRRWDERDAKRVLTELQLTHVLIEFCLGRAFYTWRGGRRGGIIGTLSNIYYIFKNIQ